MANSKFANVSDEDMQALLNTKDSVNTQRVIKRSVAVFREFLTQKSLDPEFEEYPKSELNSALRRFFASIRCKTGDNVKTFVILLRPLTRFHTGGYYTNWNIMGLEDPPTSGSTHGSLGALNKLF